MMKEADEEACLLWKEVAEEENDRNQVQREYCNSVWIR
jgi:hypothetical protein